MSNRIKMNAIHFRQNGSKLSIITLNAEDLIELTKVEHFNNSLSLTDEEQGYQRMPGTARVVKFGNFLDNKVKKKQNFPMPTAILLSDRGCDVEMGDNYITFPVGTQFNIIDGQHRKLALEHAINKKKNQDIKKYEYAAVLMHGMNRFDEMQQFQTVNGEAKSVNTALVNMILTQLHLGGEDIDPKNIWKVIAVKAIKRLNEEPESPWYQKITMPDQTRFKAKDIKDDPKKEHYRIVGATGFITSLSPVISYLESGRWRSDFESLDHEAKVDDLYKILLAYWSSLETVMKPAFEKGNNYVIQKSPGLFSFHKLLKDIINAVSFTGGLLESNSTYISMFEKAIDKHGEWFESNTWIGSNKKDPGLSGKASNFGNMQGFHELYLHLKKDLEK